MTLHEYLSFRRTVIQTAQKLVQRPDLQAMERAALAEISAIETAFPPSKPKPAPDAEGWWWAEQCSYPIPITPCDGDLYCTDWAGNFRPASELHTLWLGPIEKPEFKNEAQGIPSQRGETGSGFPEKS